MSVEMANPTNAVHGQRVSREIVIEDVSHWYEARIARVNALNDINLTIGSGEFVCVVGASGCGKTTLMRMLAGFIQPTQGSITIGGEAIVKPDPSRGVVFQQPNLYPWLNVRENVSFGPRMRKEKKDSYGPRVQSMLELVGLGDVGDRASYELSGGMQQRAAIARVLVNEPDVILMDEPFGALDAMTRESLQEELLGIWRNTHKTIFFITHSVEEAVYLGSRVIVMSPRPGEVIFDKDVRISELESEQDPQKVRLSSQFAAYREEIVRKIYESFTA